MWWLGRRQPGEVEVDGLRFAVHPADLGVTFEIARSGEYEPATRAALLSVLREGGTFIDIGAHVGLFTVPAARAVGPSGVVIAFEPDPKNRALLEANIARHGLDQVRIVPAAVSDHDGTMSLKRSRFNTGDHRLSSRGDVPVEVVALDRWLETQQVVPDVIKMDVQGAEPAVLSGMERLMASSHPLHVILEFTPSLLRGAGCDPAGILKKLVDQGFVLHVIDERSGTSTLANPETVMSVCPKRGYVNLHAMRAAS